MKTNPPLRHADSVEALGRAKASLAALAAGAALTRTSALHTEGIYRSGGESRRREHTMFERSLTPNITVTIGHHTRIYFAFVTTAPTEPRLAGNRHSARRHVRRRGALRRRTTHAR